MKTKRNAQATTPVAAAAIPLTRDETAAWDWTRGLTLLIAGATLVAVAVFLLGVRLYVRHGDRLVHDMDQAVAEVAHEQAIRYERAGDYEKAKETYLLALQGRFDDAKGRSDALMRLGRMLRWRESPEAGLPYLRQALERPDHDIALFASLCDALLAAHQDEELVRVAEQYYREASAARDDELRAQAKYFEGRGLQARGKKDQALSVFVEAETIQSGGLSACEAGMLLYNLGRPEEAKKYLETCAYASGSGQSEYAAQLLKRMEEGS